MNQTEREFRRWLASKGAPRWLREAVVFVAITMVGLAAISIAFVGFAIVMVLSQIFGEFIIVRYLLTGWQDGSFSGPKGQPTPEWLFVADAGGVFIFLGSMIWRWPQIWQAGLSRRARSRVVLCLALALMFIAVGWHGAVRACYWTTQLPRDKVFDVQWRGYPAEEMLPHLSQEAGPLLSRPQEPMELWRQSPDLNTLASPRPTPLGNWIVFDNYQLKTMSGAEYQSWLAERQPFAEKETGNSKPQPAPQP